MFCEAMKKTYLIGSKSSTARGYDILNTRLYKLYDVHLAFNKVAAIILEGLGGKENIASLDNCITRVRAEVKDQTKVDEKKIKSAGISGVMRPGKTSVQVIVGTKVQFVGDEMKKMI